MIDEETKDEILSLAEELGEELAGHEEAIGKIEDEAFMLFEQKLIALKNKLVADTAVLDEELESRYLEEAKKMKAELLEETKAKLDAYVASVKA